MRVTQKQVAELAGITQATVSYVLNGRAEELSISDKVVKRVRKAARQLGYTPSHAARSLASGRSRTLGLLLGGPDGRVASFWSHIAEGVEGAAMQSGYDVLIISGGRDKESAGLRYLRQGRADALIALGPGKESLKLWRGSEVPPVVLAPHGVSGFPTVRLDVSTGYGAAVKHLAELGHCELLWVGQPEGACYDRDAVVIDVATEAGVRAQLLHLDQQEQPFWVPVDQCIESWRSALAKALPDPPRASAILCWNDRMALGLYAVLAERGLRVPGDVSVMGFDDDEATVALPPLSTVSQEYRRIGAEATRLAVSIVEGELPADEARQTVVRVPSRFVRRQSTGPAPGRGK